MAIIATQMNIAGQTPTLVVNPSKGVLTDPIPVLLYNESATYNIYLGGAAMSIATTGAGSGWPLGPGDSIAMALPQGDVLYACVATTADASTLAVLLGRQS